MDRARIVAALTALGSALDRRGAKASWYDVAGAPIALAYDRRHSTRDVDRFGEVVLDLGRYDEEIQVTNGPGQLSVSTEAREDRSIAARKRSY